MRKLKLINIIACIFACLSLMFVLSACSSEKLKYEERGDFGYFVGAVNTDISGEIIVPAEYNGKPVYGLIEHAFENCKNITKVVLPEGLKTIGYYAFKGVGSNVVVIPVSVTSISATSFEDNGMYRIEYNGTKEQWTQIKGYTFVPSKIHVICVDGEFEL